ncbi:D-2-hydroxyacid dehydrogenase [Waddlia chondrophila]|nr:D-2-hydroxyacid dehydrogenase [Waddlia chondrophila]
MQIVLLQNRLTDGEVAELIDEFPQFLFLAAYEIPFNQLSKEEWERVEIIYGNRLSKENLQFAHQLRWIHSPVPNLNPLCLDQLEKKGNVIVTVTREENAYQIGEYVMCGILAFAKNLFHWMKAGESPSLLWNSKWRESMWTLKNKIFIQIGLGKVGTEIARRARQLEMKVWGVQEKRSFHPYCHKVFDMEELNAILPEGDVVCAALPRPQQKRTLFGKQEIKLMKEGSIFVMIGSKSLIDEGSLVNEKDANKFRGILIDAFYQVPIPPTSKLWKLPNAVITPEVAPRPKSEGKEAYSLFRYNLRQYTHGNFSDMRNAVGTKKTLIT